MDTQNLGELFAAMAAARLEFGAFTKSKVAKMGTYEYNYADLSDIISATAPALAKHGLVIIQEPEVVTEGGKQVVIISGCIAHKSGGVYQFRSLPLPVAGGTAQAIGSAISYARRYQLSALLNLAADADDDAQGADAAQAAPASKQTRTPAKAPQGAPVQATEDKARVTETQLAEIERLGEVVYPTEWENNKQRLAELFSQGARTKLEELYEFEAAKLIKGLEKKIQPVAH